MRAKLTHLLENRCNTCLWMFSDGVEESISKFSEYFYTGILSKQNQCNVLWIVMSYWSSLKSK